VSRCNAQTQSLHPCTVTLYIASGEAEPESPKSLAVQPGRRAFVYSANDIHMCPPEYDLAMPLGKPYKRVVESITHMHVCVCVTELAM